MINKANIELRCLEEGDEAAYDMCIQEFKVAGEKIIPGSADSKSLSWEDWLKKRRKNSQGIDLAPNRVPSTLYFLINKKQQKILGAVSIRHRLNSSLMKVGGNIGYGVTPSERRKGYANYMVKEALEKCKKMGLKRVLITCDKTNIGSAKTIIKNGGVLENEVVEEEIVKQRYWITL